MCGQRLGKGYQDHPDRGGRTRCSSRLSSIASRRKSPSSMARSALASEGGRLALEVDIEPRRNSRPICSGCHRKRPGYDRLPARRFEFVPLWQIAVFFVYAMRRVDCPKCGVVVEEVPWGDGKSQLTTTYRWFLAGWAKRLSWREVAEAFHTTWEAVYRSVQYAVAWGLEHRTTGRDQGPRRRRGPVAAGTPLPDAGLPDRRRGQAAALGRPGPDRGQPARVLPRP